MELPALLTEEPTPVRVTDDETSERYYPYTPTKERLDSVTTVISATDFKPWIPGWYGRSSTAWCVDHLGQLRRVRRRRGRDAAILLGKDAAERERRIKGDAGTIVHDYKEALLRWAWLPGRSGASIALPQLSPYLAGALYDGEPVAEVVDFMVTGFLNFVSACNPRFLAAEMTVYNQPLGIAGTLDGIMELDGYAISVGTGLHGADEIIACPGNTLTLCEDTKTGRNPDGTWKEQLAAYRRMLECRPDRQFEDLYPMPLTDAAVVLHLRPEYPDGWLLMLVSAGEEEKAWDRFQAAARIYRDRQAVKNKPGVSIRPLRADGTLPGPRLCDLAAEGYGRALAPLREALGGGAELEDIARFTKAELLAVSGIGPKLIVTVEIMLADHGLALADDDAATVRKAA
jgi:hypothetical protein